MQPAKPYLQFSSRIQVALRLFAITLVLFTLCRVAFYVVFFDKADGFNIADTLHAFWLGLRFDTRVALLLVLPLLLLGMFSRFHWHAGTRAGKIWVGFYTFLFAFITLIYAGDFGYYAYLESRISFRIFEFFKNFLISFKMVMQTYNVPAWGVGMLLFIYGIYRLLQRHIFTDFQMPTEARSGKVKTAQSVVITLLVLIGLHSSVTQYPLRWSDSFFNQNMFVASLGMNPLHYLFDTAANSKKDYDTNKVKTHYLKTAEYLGVKNLDAEKLNFVRDVDMSPQFFNKPNVVYIVMESMAAYKTGAFGNAAQASPSLDRLASQGWLFRHYYVPTEGTARSLFCILSGIPDINAKSTSSRNPHIVDQHTLINGLKDYSKYYFIGGNAAWGNIRGVYMNNVKGLEFYEGDHLEGPRTDVWGLSDLDLFRQAAKILKEKSLTATQTGQPFFALIQSASYHRPYTIPDEHGSFAMKTLSAEDLKKYGFNSNEEYNSFRFADYSLGEFFHLVENEKFAQNTIFVIQGDHGLPHDGAEHLSEGYKFFGLNRFHTPLVFYSPLIKKPQEHNMIITEPDVWPTILGLTGNQYKTRALGQNVFADRHAKSPRYAFSYVYYSSPLQIMLYDQNFLAFGTENKIESLHEYMSDHPKEDVKNQYPEKFNEMSELLEGIFESSKYLLHHNPKFK